MQNNNNEQYIIKTFTELTHQHRNEEAIVFIGDILKQIPLKIYLLPNIITLLLQKDSELYNNELKPFFFYTGVFLSKTSTLKETVHQFMYYLFSNDIYERNYKELLLRYEKFIVGKDEKQYPLLMVFGSILHFMSWDNECILYKQSLKEKNSKNKSIEERLEKNALSIEYKLNTSLSFFPNLEFIIKPLLKIMIYLGKVDDSYILLLSFVDQYPLNPFGYILLGSYLIEYKPKDLDKIIHCYRTLITLDPISNNAFSVLLQFYYSTNRDNDDQILENIISFEEIFKLYTNRLSITPNDLEIWKLFYYFLKDNVANRNQLVAKVTSSFQCKSFLETSFNDFLDYQLSLPMLKFKAAVFYLLVIANPTSENNGLTYINQCLGKRKNFQLSLSILEFLESEIQNLNTQNIKSSKN
ncbi:hypothetical protein RB653_009697 [Dictyostelium firmibasis]|uniref:Uncharacterized protein n=1 Tax=Dictyostelium firmibasis TaxID=79012 RepID=A0AAN7TRN7_9MYCE